MNPFEIHPVWQLSKNLSLEIFELSKAFPSNVQLGLSAQLQSSVLEIQSSIVKAVTSENKAEILYLLKLTRQHMAALESQLRVATDLTHIQEEIYLDLKQVISSIYLQLTEFTIERVRP